MVHRCGSKKIATNIHFKIDQLLAGIFESLPEESKVVVDRFKLILRLKHFIKLFKSASLFC